MVDGFPVLTNAAQTAVAAAKEYPAYSAAQNRPPKAVSNSVKILQESNHPAALGSLVWLGAIEPHAAVQALVGQSPLDALVALAAATEASESRGKPENDGRRIWAFWGRTTEGLHHEFEQTPGALLLHELLEMWDRSVIGWSTQAYVLLMKISEQLGACDTRTCLVTAVNERSPVWRILAAAGVMRGIFSRRALSSVTSGDTFRAVELTKDRIAAQTRPGATIRIFDESVERCVRDMKAALIGKFRYCVTDDNAMSASFAPLLIAIAATATQLVSECDEPLQHQLAILCIESGYRCEDAVVARNCRLFGLAASQYAPASVVVSHCHFAAASLPKPRRRSDRVEIRGKFSIENQQRRLYLALIAAMQRFHPLDPATALVGIDALSLLDVSVSFPPEKLVTALAKRIATRTSSLSRLGLLCSAVVTIPTVTSTRCLFLMEVLVISLHNAEQGRKEMDSPEERELHDQTWKDIATTLRRSNFDIQDNFSKQLSRLDKAGEHRVQKILQPTLVEACISMVAVGLCSRTVSTDIAIALWHDVLELRKRGALHVATIARVLDIIVSGAIHEQSAIASVRDLQELYQTSTDDSARQLAVVLTMRATLRCDFKILREILAVAANILQTNDWGNIVRDAVLFSDAIRKDDMLTWYFEQLSHRGPLQKRKIVSKL